MSLLAITNTLATYSYSFDSLDSVSTASASTGIFAAIMGVIAMIMIPALIIAAVCIVAMWKIFTKMGQPGWYAIIPIFNLWKLYELCGMQPWFALLPLAGVIPIVGWIVSIFAFVTMIFLYIRLAKGFGKDTGFAVGLILLTPIFQCILGFGGANWDAARLEGAPNIIPPANAPKSNAKPAADGAQEAPKEDAWVSGEEK